MILLCTSQDELNLRYSCYFIGISYVGAIYTRPDAYAPLTISRAGTYEVVPDPSPAEMALTNYCMVPI